ncbi:DNA primase [Methylococcus mesophilus]|uniref:DNA primase n=1 Tax=Methylococcus mesophilus TaxID=2993564 RepID=UPI00224A9D53|nr:DNA primase [Methylococcus mesophilus]UZR29776.1 DNA primase [Methylococcus mesophilus]
MKNLCPPNLLRHLSGVRQTGPGKWVAKCPAHEDRTPSLSIRQTEDGRILTHCFVGCGVDDVLVAVGLSVSDLFPPREPPPKGYRPHQGILEHRARDLIVLAAREASICAIVVGDMLDGRGTSVADCLRARQAVETIHGIAREVRHASHR